MSTGTYIIKRNNKRFNNKRFDSYESARSYTRKVLRKRDDISPDFWFDTGWDVHNNPSISLYGFSIERVTA